MIAQHREPIILVVPDSIDGLLSVLQDVSVKLGNALNDLDGYRTFLDATYLNSAEDELGDAEKITRFAQAGLIASRNAQEVQS